MKIKIDLNEHAASFKRKRTSKKWLHIHTPLGLDGEYTFVYTYPLRNKARFIRPLNTANTAEDLLVLGRGDYERIYAEEESAAGVTKNIPGMLNRAWSAGPYGIWGHHFSDLYFETLEIDLKNKLVEFGMGS